MKRLFCIQLVFFICASPTLFSQVVNIEEQRITGTNDSMHWYGHMRGGVSLAKVQQQSLQVHGQVKVQYKDDPHLTLLLLNLNLLRAGEQDFARQAFAHLRYNYKISETWTWEAFTQVQTSPIQLLEQRNLFGTGARYRLLKSKDGRQRIYLGAAWLWEQNRFTEPLGYSSWHRSSNYISTTFRPNKKITLIQTTYWQPVLGLIRNYRLSTEWLLKVDLTKKLAFTIDFEYGIDKNLPVGAPSETYAWRNGLSWQL
ncbi:MAG: DUF481 domain-containing protein [Saprospiraceae bacterium]|nr:DUF481 domain-containing protein [Saprospiraceae bacterium]